jgi:DNA polymerase-3 subunit beta
MKVALTQAQLAKALSAVSRFVNPRGTLSVLGNVLLETTEGRLKVSATNLELGIDYRIGAKIETDGAITVPARLITDYVNNLSDEKVELSAKDGILTITSKGAESKINGIDASEFPTIPEVGDGKSVTISSSGIKDIISKVAFAAALDETRPILSGVLFHFKDPKFSVAATDSYRLAELSMQFEKSNPEELKVVVPAKALTELGRIIGESEVSIKTADNQVQFETEDVRLISRLLEGEYPPYQQIIPGGSETKATVEREDFLAKVKTASLFSRDAGLGVRVAFGADGKIELASETAQVGDSHATMKGQVVGGDNTVTLNARYLIDCLSALDAKNVTLETSGATSPCVVKAENDDSYLYVIMPLRT